MLLSHYGWGELALVNIAGIARSKFVQCVDNYRLINSIYRLSKHLGICSDLNASGVGPLLLLVIKRRLKLELTHSD